MSVLSFLNRDLAWLVISYEFMKQAFGEFPKYCIWNDHECKIPIILLFFL